MRAQAAIMSRKVDTREPLWKPNASTELIHLLTETFSSQRESRADEALHILSNALKARGSVVILFNLTDQPLSANKRPLFTSGEYQNGLPSQLPSALLDKLWRRGGMVRECAEVLFETDARYACYAIKFSNVELLSVILRGYDEACFEDLTLLRIYSRLLVKFLRQAEMKSPDQDSKTIEQSFPPGYVKGISDAISVLYRELAMLSRGDFSILLLGETGVGKEHLARIIHAWSDRDAGPFVAVNCAAIPVELFEAEMFGIGKGIATGVQERKGYFQLAEKGTLFLDEIGELEMASQAKLLRALQDIEVRRIGGSTFKRNVRIIAATNADLRNRMEEGNFRPDLYYRIAGFELHVPPLRQRRDDIPLLVEHFLKIFSQEAGKLICGITPETLRLLINYSWPGNIRELESELRRIVYLCPNKQTINATLLSTHILLPKVPRKEPASLARYSSLLLRPHVEELERRLIRQALAWSHGNHSKAAKLLGISRNGLASKIEHLGIE